MWRRSGEGLIVGDGVEIEVLDARPNRVKLGIVAPASVAIVRKEARITREENLAAALSAGPDMVKTLLRQLPGDSQKNDRTAPKMTLSNS
jgi:carbon storage regulator CsrA